VVYTTNNDLGKLLEMQNTEKPNKFDKNGIYKLMCPTCHKKSMLEKLVDCSK